MEEALTCGELVSVRDGGVVLCLVVLVLSFLSCPCVLRFQIPPEAKLVSRLTNVSLLKLMIFESQASPPPQAPAQHDPPKSA